MSLGRALLRFLVLGATGVLLIAIVPRLWDGIRGQRRREGYDFERAQEVANASESEFIELDRTVQPGISIRS